MIELPTKFPGQKEGEQINFIIKKHWIRYAFVLAFSFFAALIPFIIVFYYILQSDQISSVLIQYLTLGIGIYLLVLMALSFYVFVDYYLDMFIVTDERIVYIRQNGFFNHQFDELNFQDVDEVGVDVKGILRSFFDYGNLIIHSGNELAVLTIDSIPHPIQASEKIMSLHKEYIEKFSGLKKDPKGSVTTDKTE